ncbi:MAG: hypothetical protein GDA46_02395 [Bdellovibrionales bacterium]|nr:hypothetical protein [Bdellovibrionales bacterium]
MKTGFILLMTLFMSLVHAEFDCIKPDFIDYPLDDYQVLLLDNDEIQLIEEFHICLLEKKNDEEKSDSNSIEWMNIKLEGLLFKHLRFF